MSNKDFQNGLIVGLAKGGGGGSSVQSDYLQNDSAAKDYIKNRPFYTETKTEINGDIIPLQEVEESDSDGVPEGYVLFAIYSAKEIAVIVDKGQYNLTIDGTTKQITTIFNPDMEGFLFGNLGIMGIGEDTGETYVGWINMIYDEKDGVQTSFVLILQTTESTHTIGLSHIGDAAPIIAEDKYSFENIDGAIVCSFTNIWEPCFEEDSVYNLTFNGEFYGGLSWSYDEVSGMSYLGNLSIPGIGDDSKENYCILRMEPEDGNVTLAMCTLCEADNYTVSLEKSLVKTIETIHKIDSKYLEVDVDKLQNNVDKLQNNVDELQNFVGTSYSEQLYERYGINRSEYPYITITNINDKRAELYFTKGIPAAGPDQSQFIFFNYWKVILDFTEEDVELKTIIKYFVQAFDSDVSVHFNENMESFRPFFCKHIYYNYEDTAINELTNSLRFDLDLATLQSEVYNIKSTLTKKLVSDGLIVNSTSEGSTKKFKITVNDDGVINAVEVKE